MKKKNIFKTKTLMFRSHWSRQELLLWSAIEVYCHSYLSHCFHVAVYHLYNCLKEKKDVIYVDMIPFLQ